MPITVPKITLIRKTTKGELDSKLRKGAKRIERTIKTINPKIHPTTGAKRQ